MNEDTLPEELPAAVGQVNGESDMRVERAGVEVRQTARPIPAEPVDPPADPEAKAEAEQRKTEREGPDEPDQEPEPTD
ncbi:hypothetical protein [Nonomuraea sp. NPDC050310]|uniref:hypothetical protein n=1 Tax=unclassified Nonomuraea TaxID=2593643 RepID=UPI003410CCAB